LALVVGGAALLVSGLVPFACPAQAFSRKKTSKKASTGSMHHERGDFSKAGKWRGSGNT
jgi:hypothetical protein